MRIDMMGRFKSDGCTLVDSYKLVLLPSEVLCSHLHLNLALIFLFVPIVAIRKIPPWKLCKEFRLRILQFSGWKSEWPKHPCSWINWHSGLVSSKLNTKKLRCYT